jgi:PAS domain S-box-containing protein
LRDVNEALLVSSVRQHELTEQAEHAEALLRAGEERYRNLFNSMDQGYCIIEMIFDEQDRPVDYRFLEVNRAFEKQSGMHDVIGRRMLEFVPEIPGPWLPNYGHTAVTGESARFAGEYRTLKRWFDVYAFKVGDSDSRKIAVLFSDITGRIEVERALRESENRYRRLFEASGDGILILDFKERRITDINPFMLELLDYPRDHFIGKELWEIGLFKDQAESQAALGALRDRGSIRYADRPLLDRNGRPHSVEVIANIYHEDREPVIQCNIRDISERKRWEDEREAHLINEQSLRMEAEGANRAKDLFLATLSHEMRTPLNAIVGWMSILRSDGCTEEDLNEGLEVIDRSTRAQVQLIEDVLDVSRIVSGKLRLDMRPCELIEAIEAGIDTVRPAAAARDITLDVRLDSSAGKITCDAARIQQVVWNLVSNAVKFTPRSGHVNVTLTREQSDLCIEVSDTGKGISADLLPFVFDRFRQADSSARRKFGGLGLGLSIVRHLVEMHGGTVEASSAGEGRGASFTVRLPIRAVRLDESPPETRDGQDESDSDHVLPRMLPIVRLDGLRVLVVDDEADARRLLVRVLQDAGAIVTAAGSAPEALEMLEAIHPEVLVSDLGMPDTDGFDLLRQVRARGHEARDLPAVALTAFVHKEDQRQAILAGFQVHVGKPVDPHDLTAVVASLAGRTGMS